MAVNLSSFREILRLGIADIVCSIYSDRKKTEYLHPEVYEIFFSNQQPDIVIHLHEHGLPEITLQAGNLLFDSGDVWRLYSINDQYVVVLGGGSVTWSPWSIVILDHGIQRIQLYTKAERMANGLYADPLQTGLGQKIFTLWLAHHGGLMAHGSGIIDDDKGYLFLGNSGDGKSTMAELWQKHGTVICDERVIIRYVAGKFRIYGTPWHSDNSNVSVRSAPLEKIFFLGHGKSNSYQNQTEIVSSTKLLVRAYHPFWNKYDMDNTLGFCTRLVHDIPCYDLAFAPNEQIVDFIRCVN